MILRPSPYGKGVAYWQDVIVGALLIIVVCADAYINILRQRGNRVRI